MKIYNTEDIEKEAINRCLAELYYFAQPSVENLEETVKEEDNKDHPFYRKHYLSQEALEYIVNKYTTMYNIKNDFVRHCDIIIDDLENGYTVDKYIEPKDGSPGYRGYEKKASLASEIGEDNANKAIEAIKSRRNFYRFDRDYERFKFTLYNYAPTSNKQDVIDYWKSQGKDIEIIDYNPDYFYERFDLGLSEETIQEIIEEDEAYE